MATDVLKFPDRMPPKPHLLTPLRSVVEVALLHKCWIRVMVMPTCTGLFLCRDVDVPVPLDLDPAQSADRYASHTMDEDGMRLCLAFGGNESVVVVPWSELKAVMVRP